MVKVSDISPLLFDVKNAEFERPIEYVQKFSTSDLPIIIQSVDEPLKSLVMTITNLVTDERYSVNPVITKINDYNVLYEFTINIAAGLYKTVITDLQEKPGLSKIESIPFSVCADDVHLKDTISIKYTNRDNITSFGALFKVGTIPRVFTLRVEGGFKSESRVLHVDNEQFRTQRQEIIELYSVPYESAIMTIGDNEGVPFEMARLINNILCLSDVKINRIRYVRSESSIPEQQSIAERYPQFNYTIKLENAENISYNGFTEYPDESSIIGNVSIYVDDAKDGEVLVFNKDAASFINQSNLDSL